MKLPAGPSLSVSGIHTSLLLFCGSAQENTPVHVQLRTGVILIATRAGTPLVPLQMLFKVQELIYLTVETVLQSQRSQVLSKPLQVIRALGLFSSFKMQNEHLEGFLGKQFTASHWQS